MRSHARKIAKLPHHVRTYGVKSLIPLAAYVISVAIDKLALRTRNIGAVECPCCGWRGNKFFTFTSSARNFPNERCPDCNALTRHRMLNMFLKARTDFFSSQLRVLDVGPADTFVQLYKRLENIECVTCDLRSHLATVRADITQAPFPDNTFDAIMCYHVLEYIPDDRLAMRELARILSPHGWAIMQVPVKTDQAETIEFGAPVPRFHGHIRWYGRDYRNRLESSGFNVDVIDFVGQQPPADRERYGIDERDDVYYVTKGNTQPNTSRRGDGTEACP